MTYVEARQIALDQEAWGKWNTAPAWRRAYECERSSQSWGRRLIADVAGAFALAASLIIVWAPLAVALLEK